MIEHPRPTWSSGDDEIARDLQTVPLELHHLDAAADLVVRRYKTLRDLIPLLPERYANPATIRDLLAGLVGKAPGVVAQHDGRMVGFLTAMLLPDFPARPAVYSPEWANGAELPSSRRLYTEMYTELARRWVADGYRTHLLTLLGHDREGVTAFHWLGFGRVVADGLRDLAPLAIDGSATVAAEVWRAGPADISTVYELEDALIQHLNDAPIFLGRDSPPQTEIARHLADPQMAIWLAGDRENPDGFLTIGPASTNACTIIRDPGTASITGAYTRPQARGAGMASLLLDRSLAWARENGYVRCAVDFETMNPQAARFWPRYFTPICTSLARHVITKD